MKGLIIAGGPDGHYQADKSTEIRKKRLHHVNYIDKSMETLFKEVREINPDYILADYSHKSLRDKSFSELGVPSIIFAGDVHRRLSGPEFREYVEFHKSVGVITDLKCSIPALEDYFQNQDIKFFWNKWGVDLSIMKDYGEEKINDVIFSGKFSNYEFRKELHDIFSNKDVIRYKYYGLEPKNNVPYEEYAHNINKSWIAIGGCTQSRQLSYYKDIFIGYTFMKTLEIPAAASCVLTSHFGDEKELGFEDRINCILFNNVREAVRKVEYYLKNKEELKEITKRGYELIHKNHDINVCINNLIDNIEKSLK